VWQTAHCILVKIFSPRSAAGVIGPATGRRQQGLKIRQVGSDLSFVVRLGRQMFENALWELFNAGRRFLGLLHVGGQSHLYVHGFECEIEQVRLLAFPAETPDT
jgi:hypothetical protein